MIDDMVDDLWEKIKKHMKKVTGKLTRPKEKVCPKCGKEPVCFGVHERRRRLIYLIVGQFVEQIVVLLIRWKCYDCEETFTEHPKWMEPYKRYLPEQMAAKSLEYAGTEGLSYRGAWELGPGKPICYNSSEDGEIDDRHPSPAFLWNWVGRVGTWSDKLLEATALIREKEPECDVYRRLKPVDPNKYRSDDRKKLLEVVLRLWLIRTDFARIYSALKNLFPRLLNGISEEPD